jgi:hypothetical protein
MNKVFRNRSLAPDEYLGYVGHDGKVYETRFGPDKYVGRVELDTGKIFEARLGPDNYLGKVELDTGKVFRHKPLAPDAYLGSVDSDGKFYRHKPLAPDEYIGKLEGATPYALGGAAFMLLVWPALEEAGAQEAAPEEGTQDTEE